MPHFLRQMEFHHVESNVVTLTDQDISYRIYLPDQKTDYIQGKIFNQGIPYEVDMLRDMRTRLSDGDLLLDIGANIGNHSLYLAATSGCRVEAFEPNTHLAEALEHSVDLNGFADRLKVNAVAMGAKTGQASYQTNIVENLGAMSLTEGAGDITVGRLDDQDFETAVTMIKIDVEGMEMEVLQGAAELIARDRPLLYVEALTEDDCKAVVGFLDQHDYILWSTFNATPTHLFIPTEQVSVDAAFRHQRAQECLATYRRTASLVDTRNNLHAANLKYRTLSGQVNAMRQNAAWQQSTNMLRRLSQLQDEARTARDAAQAQISTLTAEVQDLENRLQQASQIIPTSRMQTPQTLLAHLSPDLIAAWTRALPLPPAAVAATWMALARLLEADDPEQALTLMTIAHCINPAPINTQILGFALIAAGQGEEALRLLSPDVDDMNLSSRQQKLLALARTALPPADLRHQSATAVRCNKRVAVIMDPFTYSGYAPECDLQQISVTNWQDDLEQFKPELLLVESAWLGLDGAWQGKIGHLSDELQGILTWCQDKKIPTAFWNKEDPVHFQTFLTIAQKFDIVFTTDIDCISSYKAALGHDRVHLLPFACQPQMHNPIEVLPRKDAFCFAGAYYTRYPERTRVMDDFLSELTTSRPFVIYDRNFGKDHPDYTFPKAYQKYILGTLAPSEIDKAYKGYTFGINLNSVQYSQSMYARRVYELLACNTRIVSNYSLGLRLMFDELVVCTDSGAEALRRIAQQDETGRADRLKLAGLRKVLSEHTYSHRLAYVLDKAGVTVDQAPDQLPPVTVVAFAKTTADRDRLIDQFQKQSLTSSNLVLMLGADVTPADTTLSDRICYVTYDTAAALRLGDLVTPEGWIASFVAADYYGPNYLIDLVLATRYSTASAIGKDAYYRTGSDGLFCGSGTIYGAVSTLAPRRSILRHNIVSTKRLDHWLTDLPDACFDAEQQGHVALALDPYNYCVDSAGADPAPLVDDLPDLAPGLSMDRLNAMADAEQATERSDTNLPMIAGPDIAANMTEPAAQNITWQIEEDDWIVTSTLQTGTHTYIYEKTLRPLTDLDGPQGYRAHLLAGPGINTRFVVIYFDADQKKISNQIGVANTNTLLAPPEGTQFVRLGLRFLGHGTCRIKGLALDNHFPAPRSLIARSRVLLLTNNYPSYDNLYRNGFVHSRVRAYQDIGGITPDVFWLRTGQDMTAHEFENVNCITGSAQQLDHILASNQYDHVLVHFLTPAMWEVLKRHVGRVRVTVWIHGFEVQPWWRRAFNYTTNAQVEKAKAESHDRMIFWQDIFADLPKALTFVFVSRIFAETVFDDLEVTCPPDQYEVIHNPVDTHLFAYHEKPVAQRGQILSIRPFSSQVYANDQTVAAILALREKPFFDDLTFRIIGDGRLFEETTAPLAGLQNVILERRFLTHAQIAALHRSHGVFLAPSRMDSQGVSRDEAMSSGLVPVTSRVAAIPEFVDDTCGYMAEGEDAEGLAQAIEELWLNPDIFTAKSRAAAERVRNQSNKEYVIAAELKLFHF